MAVPQGYIKIEPNTLYENVEYYIDTSVLPTDAENMTQTQKLPNISTQWNDVAMVTGINTVGGGWVDIGSKQFGWENIVVNGVVSDIPTLNIQLTTSPDWLYVKEGIQPTTHEMTITLSDGVESLEMNFTEPESNLITFTVDGTSYQAELGMTWYDFCNSEYNTDNWYILENLVIVGYDAPYDLALTYNNDYVSYNNLILSNGEYSQKPYGSGGSGN